MSLLNLAARDAVEGRLENAGPLVEEAKAVNPGYRDSQVPEYEIFIGVFAGDFRACLAAAHTAYITNPSPPGLRRAFALGWAALAACEHDDLGLADHLLARARAANGEGEYFVFTDYRGWAEGVLACRQERPEGRELLRHTADRLVRKGAFGIASQVLADLTEWEAAHADGRGAAEAAERLGSLGVRGPLYTGLAAMARAQSELVCGDAEAAAASAGEAVELLSSTGCRAYLARAVEVLGRALPATDRTGAVAAFEQAATIFEECGASWRRDRSLEALRSLRGRGGRVAAAVTGPASLSKREREVARLAGKGLTAAEVAAELFISERTVEGHLANVYAKLGVGSKLELVRRSAEFDL